MTEVEVYIDFDGVINALWVQRKEWGWDPDSLRTSRIKGFLITWSAELVERLNALSRREHVHFHWLTTWLHEAPKMICPALELDGADWPVIGAAHYEIGARGGKSWWKHHAIQEIASPARRVVWIDDDLYIADAREWAKTLGDRIMLVQPDNRNGITKDTMAEIEEWVG